MHTKISVITSLALSALLFFSVTGCGGNKKAEQPPAKTTATQEVKKEAPKAEKTGFIVGTDVNAREKASTESAIVGTFILGEKVTIISEEPEWAKVKRSDGKECYVFKKFLGDQAALDKRQAKYNVKSGPYPVYLNANPDYVLLYGHMGTAWYVVKSSLHYKPGTKINIIKVVTVPEADKGSTKITSSHDFNYWPNDVGVEYWLDNKSERYLATHDGKGTQNIVAFTAYKSIGFIRTGKIPSDGHLPKSFYDTLNP